MALKHKSSDAGNSDVLLLCLIYELNFMYMMRRLTGQDPDAGRLRAGEGDNRGWDGRMASPIQWTRVRANSGRW